jgi:proton-translocating NADH-quinone oxidoreductase chain L
VSSFFITKAWLIPFLPLLGAIVTALLPRSLRAQSHLPVVIGIGLAFLISIGSLFAASADATVLSFHWLSVSNLEVPIELRVDGLSTIMLSMVTLVSTIVAVFSVGYMKDDAGYSRFFSLIGLFVFSMTGLVLSNNYVLTYVFWEGVGVCSYLLIGFWHSRPSAAAAALKAFLVNRIGDFGFAVAIFWMWAACHHDVSYGNILSDATIQSLPAGTIAGISFLLFWAATAKSAQIPLYTWLPDAMEGPTPVSALIHAATMVTAGVYLIARSMPLLSHAESVMALIAVIGCATAVLSALIALTQTDLKRVLAYSTVSQLGYMFMALGSGVGNIAQLAVVAAMFHLFTHAFFKALLFLAAGSVMHAMGDVIDMRRFSGLRHRLPYTCLTFAVGGLALSGIFPLSGFFSKDEVLLAIGTASRDAHSLGWLYSLIYWLAVLTAFLTAFYTGRAFFMTFWGPEKLPSPTDPDAPAIPAHAEIHDDSATADTHHHEIGHESPPIMTIPLAILAAATILIGLVCLLAGPFFGGTTAWFDAQLRHTFQFESLGHEVHGFSWFTAFVGTLAGVLGLGLSYLFYAQSSPLPAQLSERFRPLYEASLHKFKIDELYDTVFVGPARVLAQICEFIDVHLLDRLVVAIARLPGRFASDFLAPYQNGLIQFYAAVSALAVAGFLFILLLF